jgi:hypothetical protein
MKKVEILNCENKNWWYSDLVGSIIKVEDKELENDYIAIEKYKRNENDELINTGFLLKSDCKII